MRERQTCADCRALSPETETSYTLIGSRYGWRLTKRRDAHGRIGVEWRCPKCWRVYKAAGGEGVPSSPEDAAPTPPVNKGVRK
jgi:hypothetical protein